jgi:hypothetical protein
MLCRATLQHHSQGGAVEMPSETQVGIGGAAVSEVGRVWGGTETEQVAQLG